MKKRGPSYTKKCILLRQKHTRNHESETLHNTITYWGTIVNPIIMIMEKSLLSWCIDSPYFNKLTMYPY